MKLSAVSSIVKGKRVVMIDDSIVRGTTSKRIVRLLKEAGAREVHVRIASPAIKYPCFYGVDMSTMDELISNRLNVNELCNYIEADSLAFITEEGIDKSIHFNKEKHKCSLCLACFNGEYVTNLYDSFEMDKSRKVRNIKNSLPLIISKVDITYITSHNVYYVNFIINF